MSKEHPVYSRLLSSWSDDAKSPVVREIAVKDVSALIRTRLRERYPDVDFSVRTDRGGSGAVRVYWTDGPPQSHVQALIGDYAFGGFDGFIDLGYSIQRWLNPDGTMSLAYCAGTGASGGSVPKTDWTKPLPRALLVQHGPRWMVASREISPGLKIRLAVAAAKEYGIEYDGTSDPGTIWIDSHGMSLAELSRKIEAGSPGFVAA